MYTIKQIGYIPAYGLYQNYKFTKQFPYKISICIDNVDADPTADINILLQSEPPNLYIKFYGMILENQHKFDLILSYDPRTLQLLHAKEFCPVGSWISDSLTIDKRDQISFIMSSKINGAPYRMRFKILKRYRNATTIGPFEFKFHRSPPLVPSKDPFFANAKFNIACENQDMPNMFTEKLLDCFKTYRVPIYFGCTNIGNYFDIRGILQFFTIEEFDKIIANLTPDVYDSMFPYVLNNYELAKPYWEKNVFQRIEDEVEKFIDSKKPLNTFI